MHPETLHIAQAEKRRKTSAQGDTPVNFQPSQPVRQEPLRNQWHDVKERHVPGVYTNQNIAKQQIRGHAGPIKQRLDTREDTQPLVVEPSTAWSNQPNTVQHDSGVVRNPIPGEARHDNLRAPNAQLSGSGSQHLPAPYTFPAPRFDATALPAIPSLYTNTQTTTTTQPSIKIESSYAHHDPPFGGFDGSPDHMPLKPPSRGVAIAEISTPEMVVDRDETAQSPKLLVSSPSKSFSDRIPGASEASPVVDSILDEIIDDDTYHQLLEPLELNDKVALVLNATSRGQRLAQKMAASENEVTKRITRPLPSAVNAESHSAAASCGRDGLLSGAETPDAGASTPKDKLTVQARHVVASIEPLSRPSWTGGLSLEEAHLLIFLKEKKGYKWTEITARFQKHYPERTYGVLQVNYSQKINRRDRSQDPPTLILPSCYASLPQADEAEVQASPKRRNCGGRPRKHEVNDDPERVKKRSRTTARSTAIDVLQDHSSGAESTHARRPRRAVPIKNYTWPTRSAVLGDESFRRTEGERTEPSEEPPAHSESPGELTPAPEKAIAVENKPLSIDFDAEDANLALTSHNRSDVTSAKQLPYLSSKQRSSLRNVPVEFEWDQLISRDWQGTVLHIDFTPEELEVVEEIVTRFVASQRALRYRSPQRRIHRLLDGLLESDLLRVVSALRLKLPSRDRKSIEAFLQDAKQGEIRSTAPRIERLAAARPNKSFSSVTKMSVASTIRHREIGAQSRRGWSSATRPISYRVKDQLQDTLGPLCSYTGASSDVHAVAWSVDGQCFAAGAICVDDPYSMQYNRPNNLLYGNVFCNTINELGRHHVTRPRTESGPNSTHAMYASQDPKLFKTVTSVAFSPNGRYMFSGGWDNYVAVWQTRYDGSQPQEIVGLRHKAEVHMMSVNASGVLATGTNKPMGNAVKVIRINDDDPSESPTTINFSSEKASQRPDMNLLPTALHFSPRHENLLLAGFSAQVREDGRDLMGDICIWDVNGNRALSIWGSGKSVFDLSFHPRNRWFAVGTVAGQNTNRGTRSTVRLYDEHNTAAHEKFSALVELECPALDINDVVWW